MLPMRLIAGIAGGQARDATLSGETIVGAQASPSSGAAGVLVKTDGTVFKQAIGPDTQIDAATDWIIANSRASPVYEIRIINVVWVQSGDGEIFSQSFESVNVWKALTSDAQWRILQTDDTPASKQVTFDLQMRWASGSVLTTGSYDLTATVSA